MFKLIKEEEKYIISDEYNENTYCLNDISEVELLVDYINNLLNTIDSLKLNTISSNIYNIQHISDKEYHLEDYNGKHDLILSLENKKDNKKLVKLLEDLEERGDTYLGLSIILAKKLGFRNPSEFFNAINEGYLETV